MIDGVIAGTGNSRFLKSAIAAETTWEQFKALVIAGTLPIDLNGANPDGWTALGTPLSKANLLSDTTAAALEAYTGETLPVEPTINDAFYAISQVAGLKIATGTYTGTGTYGSGNPNSLTFDFEPKIVFVATNTTGFGQVALQLSGILAGFSGSAIFINPCPVYKSGNNNAAPTGGVVSWGTTVSWYTNGSNASSQFNANASNYDYVAIG